MFFLSLHAETVGFPETALTDTLCKQTDMKYIYLTPETNEFLSGEIKYFWFRWSDSD